ncbi:hypothetical protein NWH84_000554 [Salmonella enterica]|nr:hypothetical protein [Salmonella enterica]EJS8563245.1 hypothetical protein [Salmonella enterica]EJS8568098.1 hypothetical protein [Salmonella enterica]EKS3672839.1 hypothetical protein [Salmonella enterica]ELW6562294.1 hypothetical protein [Salmonella enterica]
MNTRVVDAESYIFSAIISIDIKGFTTCELAQALVEQFNFPKNMPKTMAFSYRHLQYLVKKGLLIKKRKSGIYQHIYSRTVGFNEYAQSIKLVARNESLPALQNNTSPICSHYEMMNILLKKYQHELEVTTGKKEVYDELINDLPGHNAELKSMSETQYKKVVRINAKIEVLASMIS